MAQVGDNNVFSDHNVYILGAGFSVDAGIPVLKDFLYAMRDSLNYLRANGREWERKAVEKVLEFRREAASAAHRVSLNLENIEDLFSLAAASSSSIVSSSVPIAIAATIDCAHQRTKRKLYEATVAHTFTKPSSWSKKNDGSIDAIYRLPIEDAYVGLISSAACNNGEHTKNTIITFNYDMVVEESLRQWVKKIWYGFNERDVEIDDRQNYSVTETQESIRLLKLHGSINWTYPDSAEAVVRVCSSYSDIIALEKNVILVPPTWKKGTNSGLDGIWSQAIKALSNATRIIVIGFSLPTTDIHFKYLLAAGLQENISLRKIFCFNPAESVRDNLFAVLRPELELQEVAKFDACGMDKLILDFSNNYQPKSILFNRDISQNLKNLTLASE